MKAYKRKHSHRHNYDVCGYAEEKVIKKRFSLSRMLKKLVNSKFTIIALMLITFVLCLMPMQSGEFADGEAYSQVISGWGFVEFSPISIITLIAPLLVPLILFGCQSKEAKELEIMILLITNIVCFVNGANATTTWLLMINSTLCDKVYPAIILYPAMFSLLCLFAIGQNAEGKECVGKSRKE